jgi:hypothetical protein
VPPHRSRTGAPQDRGALLPLTHRAWRAADLLRQLRVDAGLAQEECRHRANHRGGSGVPKPEHFYPGRLRSVVVPGPDSVRQLAGSGQIQCDTGQIQYDGTTGQKPAWLERRPDRFT